MAATRRIAVPMGIEQPFKRHAGKFAGICDYAEQQGNWDLIIDEWADHALPARAGAASPYDGIVGRISPLCARRARRLGVPVVNVHFSSPARGLPGVFPDYAACGRLRAEHLLARGFRNFGVQVFEPDRASHAEIESFEQTVRAAGHDAFHRVELNLVDRSIDSSTANYRQWQLAMRTIDRWMDQWLLPIGLFLNSPDIARVVIEKCKTRGWRVPENVAIVAGWNEVAQCERPSPSITSLEVPNEQVGYEAARMLDRLIDEQQNRKRQRKAIAADPPAPETILLPPVGIVARRSTDFYAVDDALVQWALRFMDSRLHERLNVDMIAAAVDVSRRTLENRFRDKLQRTVAREIQRLRIERTKRELTSSDRPINQIVRQVGFRNTRTLNIVFRDLVGCTPTEFRRRGRQPGRK